MADSLTDVWQDPAEAIGELLVEKETEKLSSALSNVPMVSVAIAMMKTRGVISDYILTKKVQQFYTAWDHLDENERHKVYQKFQKKPKAFVEKLFYIVAQQEDLSKCRVLGMLTVAYLKGDIKRADYLDLIETMIHMSVRDLMKLVTLSERSLILPERETHERYAMLFVSRGLMTTEIKLPEEQREGEERFYRITDLGKLLATYARTSKLKEIA